MPNAQSQKCMKPSWTAPKSSYQSSCHAAASPAHHLPFAEGGHHRETAISTTVRVVPLEATDHRPWEDHDTDFHRPGVRDRLLVGFWAGFTEAGVAEVAEGDSAARATTTDTGLDDPFPARALDRPDEACLTRGQEAHRLGAAEVVVVTGGEILHHEGAEVAAAVGGAQAIARMVATAVAEAGAEGVVLPGDRNAGRGATPEPRDHPYTDPRRCLPDWIQKRQSTDPGMPLDLRTASS